MDLEGILMKVFFETVSVLKMCKPRLYTDRQTETERQRQTDRGREGERAGRGVKEGGLRTHARSEGEGGRERERDRQTETDTDRDGVGGGGWDRQIETEEGGGECGKRVEGEWKGGGWWGGGGGLRTHTEAGRKQQD